MARDDEVDRLERTYGLVLAFVLMADALVIGAFVWIAAF